MNNCVITGAIANHKANIEPTSMTEKVLWLAAGIVIFGTTIRVVEVPAIARG